MNFISLYIFKRSRINIECTEPYIGINKGNFLINGKLCCKNKIHCGSTSAIDNSLLNGSVKVIF